MAAGGRTKACRSDAGACKAAARFLWKEGVHTITVIFPVGESWDLRDYEAMNCMLSAGGWGDYVVTASRAE